MQPIARLHSIEDFVQRQLGHTDILRSGPTTGTLDEAADGAARAATHTRTLHSCFTMGTLCEGTRTTSTIPTTYESPEMWRCAHRRPLGAPALHPHFGSPPR